MLLKEWKTLANNSGARKKDSMALTENGVIVEVLTVVPTVVLIVVLTVVLMVVLSAATVEVIGSV